MSDLDAGNFLPAASQYHHQQQGVYQQQQFSQNSGPSLPKPITSLITSFRKPLPPNHQNHQMIFDRALQLRKNLKLVVKNTIGYQLKYLNLDHIGNSANPNQPLPSYMQQQTWKTAQPDEEFNYWTSMANIIFDKNGLERPFSSDPNEDPMNFYASINIFIQFSDVNNQIYDQSWKYYVSFSEDDLEKALSQSSQRQNYVQLKAEIITSQQKNPEVVKQALRQQQLIMSGQYIDETGESDPLKINNLFDQTVKTITPLGIKENSVGSLFQNGGVVFPTMNQPHNRRQNSRYQQHSLGNANETATKKWSDF